MLENKTLYCCHLTWSVCGSGCLNIWPTGNFPLLDLDQGADESAVLISGIKKYKPHEPDGQGFETLQFRRAAPRAGVRRRGSG